MPSTTKEKVTVAELSKYGFKRAEGNYVGWSKTLQEDKSRSGEMGKVVPGLTLEMEIYTAASGKQYVNKVFDVIGGTLPKTFVPKEAVKVIVTPKLLKEAAAASTMSKDEWAAKDQRISRQGVIQAAVQAVAPLVALEQLFDEADKLATQMLEFVNRK